MKAICFIPRHPIQRNTTTHLYFRLCIFYSLDETCMIKEKARLNLHLVGFYYILNDDKKIDYIFEII